MTFHCRHGLVGVRNRPVSLSTWAGSFSTLLKDGVCSIKVLTEYYKHSMIQFVLHPCTSQGSSEDFSYCKYRLDARYTEYSCTERYTGVGRNWGWRVVAESEGFSINAPRCPLFPTVTCPCPLRASCGTESVNWKLYLHVQPRRCLSPSSVCSDVCT